MKTALITLLLLLPFCFQAQKLTIEKAVLGQSDELAPESLEQLSWLKSGDLYSYVENDKLLAVQAKSGRVNYSVDLPGLNNALGLELKSFPRISWETELVFSFVHDNAWYRYNVKSDEGQKWMDRPKNAGNVKRHNNGNIAYTRDNNVYIKKNDKEMQVTDLPEGVSAGIAIARYEFGITEGLFWSPKGKKLGFYQKDERNVKEYPLVDYTATPAAVDYIRYPMAGDTSEIASFGVFDVKSGKLIYLNVNNGVKDDSYYITNVAWNPDGTKILAAIVNREQNNMELVRFNASNGARETTLFSESHAAYVEPESPPIFLKDESGDFLWFSERDGYNNLYRYNEEGELLGMTDATFPITRFVAFDSKGKYAFVEGHGPNPTEQHAFRIELRTMQLQKLTTTAGTHSILVSASGKYLLDRLTSLEIPNRYLLLNASGKIARTVFDAPNPLSNYTVGKTEFLTLTAKNGTDLYARMITPPAMVKGQKYPAVVYVYNGPHVQLVRNTWMGSAPLWMHSLAADGYVVFTIDGRGSANRGRDFEQAIFRRVGTLELEDQMAGVSYLKNQSFVDPSRLAVHGWSYGGFMTTSLMLKFPGVFKVGVAGGPVIDWRMYEVMYTERYMDTPQENPKGFEAADLTNYVTDLEGKLLMIHGNVDDVVVMQHNMRFLKACVDNQIPVDFFVYPGHPHNVRGKDRVHLMEKVIAYIKAHL